MPIFFLLGFLACQEDDTPPPVVSNPEITLLTFKQDASSSTSFSDDWIFVTNETGDVLDIKHFEAEEIIVLKSDKVTSSQKINVTIFHYLQPSTETIDFKSYLGITPNQTWIYEKRNPYSVTKTGTATFNVTNTTPPASLGITVSTNLGFSATRISSPTSVIVDLYKSSERILASDNIDGTPSYFEASAIQNGNTITADYNTEFKPLQNLYSIDVSGSDSFTGSVYGLLNEPGKDPSDVQGFLNYSITSGSLNSYKWGYNSGYDRYRISMGKSSGKTSRHYFKLGAPVETILFPDHSFSLENGNLNGFACSLSAEYQLRNSKWTAPIADYQSVLVWSVYAPPGAKQIFSKIPDEIKSLYPSLAIESLVLKDNTFTIFLDGFTYSDFVNGQMNIASSKKTYSMEYQKIVIQN